MLTVSQLACTRGERRLFSALDFEVDRGECVHVQGENGSGKTSLLRIVSGLAHAAEGQVLWNGEDTRKLGEAWHAELLFIGHHHAVKEELTARENVMLSALLDGHALPDVTLQSALSRMGLRGREDLPVRYLSQGQKRRVALTRLLTRPARLWLLDEPFTALDTAAVELVGGLITEHLAGRGSVLLTSHQPVSLPGGRVRTLRLGA
jgi:heme exporter protein A